MKTDQMKRIRSVLAVLICLAASLPLFGCGTGSPAAPAESPGETANTEMSGTLPTETEEAGSFTLSVPEQTLPAGAEDTVTLTAGCETTLSILNGTLRVTYDPEALELQVPENEDELCKLPVCAVNASKPGTVLMAFIDSDGMEGSVIIAALPFRVLDPRPGAAHTVTFSFTELVCDDGTALGRNLAAEDPEAYVAVGTIRVE